MYSPYKGDSNRGRLCRYHTIKTSPPSPNRDIRQNAKHRVCEGTHLARFRVGFKLIAQWVQAVVGVEQAETRAPVEAVLVFRRRVGARKVEAMVGGRAARVALGVNQDGLAHVFIEAHRQSDGMTARILPRGTCAPTWRELVTAVDAEVVWNI